ncbi:MAG: ATP phosphoribosyltransferase regulatory subunit, partial [Clostridia bacterium]|nr:ATP phosphoribosyltransferase regulatory subunit [Clostridia bacterium]
MKFSTSPVRGTVDYLPSEMEVKSYAERVILETYKQNGFLQIKTPILENLDLLTNGDSGDNQKLMFKTIKRGEKLDLAKPDLKESDIVEEGLRYDLTVPLVRLFANNKEKLPIPFKAIQIDESFRAERPQKGRVRQFTQCDIDILGDSSPLSEVELLYAYMCAYKNLGFSNLTIKVNDRRALASIIKLSGFAEENVTDICISLDKFDKIGAEAVANELVANGYAEAGVKKLMSIFADLKSATSNAESFKKLAKFGVDAEVVGSLKLIISTVEKFKIEGFNIMFDASIIRGQGYYTGTVFEVYDNEFGRAIGGGGRYDKMIEKFLNVSVPAVGASIGLYSVVMLMVERG